MTKKELFIRCIKKGVFDLITELRNLAGYFFTGVWLGAGLWLGGSAMQALLT